MICRATRIASILSSGVLILTPPAHRASASAPEAERPPKSLNKRFFKLKTTDTLSDILRRHGFSERDVAEVQRSNPLPKGFSLSHSETYRVRTSPDRSFAEVKIYEPAQNRSIRFWRDHDSAHVEEREETLDSKLQQISGTVNGSLLGSISSRLNIPWIAHRFMDAFLIDYNRLPSQLERGSPFEFVVETKWDEGDLIGYGQILEAGLRVGGQFERRYYVEFPGGGAFINPLNPNLNRPLFAPVSYLRISSLYNPRRVHPIRGRRQPHLGVDFELPEGSPVYASASGVVLRSGRQRAAGNFVVIRHEGGLETYYNHLQSISPSIQPQVRVNAGQVLGAIGCTGFCTKPHLHFSVRKNHRSIDPLSVLRSYPYRSHQEVVRIGQKLRQAN